jgi:hypothetical protein
VAASDVSLSLLQNRLSYDPATGVFVWLNAPRKPWLNGKPAGTPNGKGYLRIMIRVKSYLAHRLAFLFVTGASTHSLGAFEMKAAASDAYLAAKRRLHPGCAS